MFMKWIKKINQDILFEIILFTILIAATLVKIEREDNINMTNEDVQSSIMVNQDLKK